MTHRTFALVATLVSSLLAGPVLAHPPQLDDARRVAEAPPRFGGAGFVMIGPRLLDLGAVSDDLERSGFSRPGNTYLGIGGGGHVMLGRWVLGGEGQGLIGVASVPFDGDEIVELLDVAVDVWL